MAQINIKQIEGWPELIGDQGLQGEQGIQGTIGNQGIQGIQGDQGEQGIQGTIGEQGIQGITGNQGIQGTKGDQGEQGIQGITGEQGTQGTTGNQGIQGTKGDQGEQGIQGTTGNQGIQGTKGDQGEQGIQGTKGDQGEQGIQGTKGDQGEQGIQGTKGDQGEQGIQGITGIQGIQGTIGDQGFIGVQGAIGLQGPMGFQGSTGTNGSNGATGVQGSQGPIGFQGTNGSNGATGAQGSAGTNGSNGATGAQGSAGTNGSNGATGATGSTGAQGLRGFQGVAGTNGSNGATGATGAQGYAGTNGSNGATGATGAQGYAGTNGSNGATGGTGAQGATGAQGTAGTNGGTGAQGATGQSITSYNASSVGIPDWRDTNYQPNQFDGHKVGYHFNNVGTLGGNSDNWMVVQTVSPWSSYDPSHRQQQLLWGGSAGLSFRYATGSASWGAWSRILDSNNFSAFAINRGGDTITNTISFKTNQGGYSGSLDSAKLQVTSDSNNSAFMSFHKHGMYAINMGLDADNVFRIGGWSAAANRLQLDMSGNLTVAGTYNASAGYVSTGNPWGTADSAFFPNGITTAGGTNWIYGKTFIGNAPANGSGHEFQTNGDSRHTGTITPNYIGRPSHSTGHLVGSYNNIGGNSGNTNPIYTIGSSYNPTDTSLAGMYGVGYSHPNLWGSGKTSDWGMYVCAGGTINATMGSGSTTIWAQNDIVAYSDARVKDNIEVIPNAISKIKELRGVTFTRIDANEEDRDKRHAGVIAQEVLKVLPEVVSGTEEDKYSVAYGNMAALFIEAIKEQQLQIEELQRTIKILTNK